MRDLSDSADEEHPSSASAFMRSRLRALADRHREEIEGTEDNAENPEEHLWNRVLGLAAPMVTFEPPDRAR